MARVDQDCTLEYDLTTDAWHVLLKYVSKQGIVYI